MTVSGYAALVLGCFLALAPGGAAGEEEPAAAPPGSEAPAPSRAQAVDLGETAFLVHSPFPDAQATTRLVDGLALGVALGRGYAEEAVPAPEPGEPARALLAPHAFAKRSGRNTLRLQLAAAPAAAGGFDVYVAGTTESERPRPLRGDFLGRYFTDVLQTLAASAQLKANPELAGFKEAVLAYVDAQAAVRPPAGAEWLGRVVHQLNYAQTDRTLATLKALGYATVEYQAGDGDSAAEKTFRMAEGSDPARLPVILKLLDASKTSLNDPPPVPPAESGMAGASPGPTSVVNLGGVYMHGSTAGDAQQRLLILHDRRAPQALERLLNTLQDLDAPARQVIIDAQVVEVTGGHTTELGLQWGSDFGKGTAAVGNTQDGLADASGVPLAVGVHPPRPFAFGYDSLAVPVEGVTFRMKLRALETSGDATLLSSPSVLVLDGRQARIQVGKQVPLTKVFAYGNGTTQADSSNYMPVGIVLNIKPRVAEDGKFVTMQVETIVSDTRDSASGAAPVLDNRQVQSFVRVADNTPFVIGGLMSDNRTSSNEGLPFLSRIPIIGWLFGVQDRHRGQREVIIVITPHVVPVAPEAALAYVVPRASESLNTLESKLFRNAYRVKASDLEELRYLLGNEAIQGALEPRRRRAEGTPAAGLLRDRVPGEEVLVRQALWRILLRLGYADLVPADRLQLYAQAGEEAGPPLGVARLLPEARGANTVAVSFPTGAAAGSPFAALGATVKPMNLAPAEWAPALRRENGRGPGGQPRAWTILLTRQDVGLAPLDVLRGAVVLRRVLQLNPGLASAGALRPGVQVLFPSREDLKSAVHTVDAAAAELFYQVALPVSAFRDAFEAEVARIDALLERPAAAREAERR